MYVTGIYHPFISQLMFLCITYSNDSFNTNDQSTATPIFGYLLTELHLYQFMHPLILVFIFLIQVKIQWKVHQGEETSIS